MTHAARACISILLTEGSRWQQMAAMSSKLSIALHACPAAASMRLFLHLRCCDASVGPLCCGFFPAWLVMFDQMRRRPRFMPYACAHSNQKHPCSNATAHVPGGCAARFHCYHLCVSPCCRPLCTACAGVIVAGHCFCCLVASQTSLVCGMSTPTWHRAAGGGSTAAARGSWQLAGPSQSTTILVQDLSV